MHRASDASMSAAHGSPSGSPSSGGSSSSQPFDVSTEGHVCPFCGLTREITDDFDATAPCPRCTLADTPTTRNATKARIGPWHVRQMRNPWAPGMRWETLLALIKRGQVTKDSIVRGPTTHQLWKRASEVKGLSREFGLCYSCGGEIDTQANLCGHCNRLQEPPVNPNVLVETREFAQQQQQNAAAAATTATPSAPVAIPAPSASASRSNGHRPHRREQPPAADDSSAAADLDIGSATPPVTADPEEMLTVDDPESAAALARSITSRPPTRPSLPDAKTALPAPPTASPAAREEPPTRPVPIRPRQPGADDALLTPQELAAAFQLNFGPQGGNATSPNGAAEPMRPPMPRRKRSKLFVAFIVLLLIGAGAAVLMYLRPDLRERAEDWSDRTYASVKQFIVARTSPKSSSTSTPTLEPVEALPTTGPTLASQSPSTPKRPDPIVIGSPAPSPRKSVDVADASPQARETTKELEPVVETPMPASAKTSGAAAATTPAPAPVEIINIQPPPPGAAKPAARPPQQEKEKVWTSLSEAEDEARRLWRLAIDAEQNQDFVEAVSCYEKIKKLPNEVHPRGLDVRLSLAKKLMK